MKRIIALLLCILMTATIFAGCQKPEQTPKGVFEAGYAREDITPDPKHSYNLAGHGYARPSTDVWDNLCVTCTAMKDEDGNIFLMYNCDFLKVSGVLNMSKIQISKNTGVPIENIMISTTHSHSAPDLDEANSAVIEDYVKIVKKAMVKAAQDAIADLKPAKIHTTEIDCEGFLVIRSIGVSSDFANELDKTMELIKFTREGGKDIVMMNWQGHPRGHAGNMLIVLADVDIIRKNIEPALDCNFMFFLGAAGNIDNNSRNQYTTYVEHYEALTQKAVEAAATFKEVPAEGAIRKVTTTVELSFKAGTGVDNASISIIAVGKSLAFVIVPYEMFSYSAKELKAYSQFDQTFIVTCADNHYGYLPTIATPADEYEVGATQYIMGSAEMLVEGYQSLFDQLK